MMRVPVRLGFAIAIACLWLFAACGAAQKGEPCEGGNCAAGLVCDPVTLTCQNPNQGTDGSMPGTDATSETDGTVGTDAVTGTDATLGTDSASGTDASSGTDSATDAGPGVCPSPPLPTSPLECFQACSPGDTCIWGEGSCCPCSSGGSSIAINAAYLTQWTSRRMAMCPGPPPPCPDVYLCLPGSPSCIGGVCQ